MMDAWAKTAIRRAKNDETVQQVEVTSEHVLAIKRHRGQLVMRKTSALVRALEKSSTPVGFAYCSDLVVWNAIDNFMPGEAWHLPTAGVPASVERRWPEEAA